MKIPKNKDVVDIGNTPQSLLKNTAKGVKKVSNDVQEQKIQLSLSKAISAELNPETMAAERRKKVEHLKKLVQSGQYNPPSDQVAQALSQEIDLEILSAGNGEVFSK